MTDCNKTTFDKNAFIDVLLEHGVLKFGEFTLKSGRISPYFFNAGLLSSGKALAMLADGYADVLANRAYAAGDDLTIFGAAYKGIPFVAATAQALYNKHNINAHWGYNRKEAKMHGEGGVLVGADLVNKSVWVIDDVMTAGTAIREVASLLQGQNAQLAGVVVALDRQEKGKNDTSAVNEVAAEFAVPVYSLFTLDDIIVYLQQISDGQLDKSAQIPSTTLLAMQNYRQRYGI